MVATGWLVERMSRFIANELVWVKLGGVHWPAVVKDKADCEEFLDALKRDPIVVVEFFDKKLHDVHNRNEIHRYNCEEKEELIIKSLQLTRNKVDISENFKKDVITAEKVTDGDIHILSKDTFSISGRQRYDDLFGNWKKTPSKPNVKRKALKPEEIVSKPKSSKYSDIFPENQAKSRKSSGKPKKPIKVASETPRLNITHPRFIAENDHKIRILAPCSPEPCAAATGSDRYRCTQCTFTTGRLNVLVLHNKLHVAAANRPPAVKRKNAEPGDPTKKSRKKAADAGSGSSKPQSKSASKTATSGAPKKTSGSSTPTKKSGPSTPVKKSTASTPTKSAKKTVSEKSRTPSKVSPLKPATSSRPMLLEDWDEDDDEEVAERLKIQSEIDRFISDKRDDSKDKSVEQERIGPTVSDLPDSPTNRRPDSPPAGRLAHSPAFDPTADSAHAADERGPCDTPVNSDWPAPAEHQQQQLRSDVLLQAAVDDMLADTAPAELPALPPAPPAQPAQPAPALSSFDFCEPTEEAMPPRPRPVRVCPAASSPPRLADLVTSSVRPAATPTSSVRPAATPSSCDAPAAAPSSCDAPAAAPSSCDAPAAALPPNLQILSVPGGDGQPDTYVLVSVDEKGNVQTVNPLDNLEGLGADTLLAYEVVQEDGTTRTAYLNPAALSTSVDIRHLLGDDGKVDSSTPLPDSSSK